MHLSRATPLDDIVDQFARLLLNRIPKHKLPQIPVENEPDNYIGQRILTMSAIGQLFTPDRGSQGIDESRLPFSCRHSCGTNAFVLLPKIDRGNCEEE